MTVSNILPVCVAVEATLPYGTDEVKVVVLLAGLYTIKLSVIEPVEVFVEAAWP